MVEGDENYSEANSLHPNLMNVSKQDAEGWYIATVDLSACKNWKGNVVAFRFDPCNGNGVYHFDYIRFSK